MVVCPCDGSLEISYGIGLYAPFAGCRDKPLQAWPYPEGGASIQVRLVRVIDGDTLNLVSADGEIFRVRLFGIDAPEKGQPYSLRATRYLTSLTSGAVMSFEQTDTDNYGREVGVLFADGIEGSINLAMIRAGLARHYTCYGALDGGYDAQREAQAERRGMWDGRGRRGGKRDEDWSGWLIIAGVALFFFFVVISDC